MPLRILQFLFVTSILPTLFAAAPEAVPVASQAQKVVAAGLQANEAGATGSTTADRHVYVIPVRGQIGSAVHYVIRRGLKEAIERKADAIVLDVDTPGGSAATTLEIMEALEKFPGQTLTFVNREAMSAGAFIAATTHEIWFAPGAIMGAAAPVSAGGQDIDETMKDKMVSYLTARVRAVSEGRGFRGEVVSAMITKDHELKIDGIVLREKGGRLLSLTSSEAAKTYGQPPVPLLSAGTAKNLDDLFAQRFGGAKVTRTTLELTWSESLAAWLNAITPILLGVGLLALFIEFKTPGFGVFGIVGIALLAVVFLSSWVAGLSGHEPMLLFAVGIIFVALEILFLPGSVIFGVSGVFMIIASLLWAMADLWPNEPITVAWSADAFVRPVISLGLGLSIAVVLAVLLARFIPRGWFWQHLAIAMPVAGSAQTSGVSPEAAPALETLLGQTGVVVAPLHPAGQVEIGGKRFEARLDVGSAGVGAKVRVKRLSDFGLIVEVLT